MTLLGRFLQDRRRSMLWWLLAIVGLVAFTAAFFPSVEGDQAIDDAIKDLPEAVRELFGLQEGVSISSAPGYLNARLYSTLLPILLLIFGISAGTQAIAGDEEEGTLELLLSNPVTRLRVSVERYAGMALLLALLALASLLAVALIGPLVGLLDGVSTSGLLGVSAAMLCLGLIYSTAAFAAGAATGRRTPAIASAAGLAVAGYMLHGVAATSNAIEPVGWISPWHWYLDRNMLVHGASLWPIVLPLVFSVPLAAAGIALFLRRDLH
jgi:beta-exotoxin I transport system permease protein